MQDFLKLENLSYTYQAENNEVQALKNIDLSINKGEFVTIVGPSGCGKSTLLSIMAGLLFPSSGSIWLNGEKIQGINPKMAYMQQSDNLLEWRNIEKNILFGLQIQKKLTPKNREYAYKLIKTYGLSGFEKSAPSQLSGGMRQRAALIRTLSIQPAVLLLDEAFSALDYQTRLQVTNDVRRILKAEGKTTVMVTHDIPESISMSDRVIVLSSRPGTIKNIHTMDFDKNKTPLQRRQDEYFNSYFNKIWGELVE